MNYPSCTPGSFRVWTCQDDYEVYVYGGRHLFWYERYPKVIIKPGTSFIVVCSNLRSPHGINPDALVPNDLDTNYIVLVGDKLCWMLASCVDVFSRQL